ncbi:hypothetical protein KPL74_08415 [Bacillus sp. NP157]|nr:hypothetical protein KPL74_08415 [Bacillus sp. NP157]
MGWNDHISANITQVLIDMLAAGFLTPEDVGYDIAIKVRDRGAGALTGAEREIYEMDLRPLIESFDQGRNEPAARHWSDEGDR